jgi:N-acetylglucosaminyldiphosphoundecaprenol N-acetyl-beta-D-mannosaminyltransferase
MPPYRRVDILGCPFDAVSFDDVVTEIERAVTEQRQLQVVPGNVDFVMKARADRTFRGLLGEIELIVADGVPITWAAALLGTPLKRRVSGTDVVSRCADISAKTGAPVALIGAAPGIAERAATQMRAMAPGSTLYVIPTPMTLGPSESEKVVTAIQGHAAKIVLVALGAPRQERWIRQYLAKSGAYVGIGVGSAFDIISGHKPRAPAFMADNGFEWLHRMVQEPKRLGRRYLIENSPFLMILAREYWSRRIIRSRA